MKKIKSYFSKNIFLLLIIIAGALSLGVFSGKRLDSDEGVVLYNSWQFWNGNFSIYTDKFVEYLSPGTSLLIYCTWKIFGSPSFLVARLFFWFFFFVGSIGCYLILKKYRIQLHLILFFFLCFSISLRYTTAINHNSFGAFASVWILYLLLVITGKKQASYFLIILLGILTAFELWLLQSKGVALFFLSLIIIVKYLNNRLKWSILYSVSFLASSIFLFSLTGFSKTAKAIFTLPFILNYLYANQHQAEVFYVFLALVITALMFIVSLQEKRRDYLVISFFQLFSFLSSATNFNSAHFAYSIFPAIIFYLVYYQEHIKILRPLLGTVNKIIFIGFFIILAKDSISNLFFQPNIFNMPNSKELNNPKILSAKNIYAGPFLPGVYYETGKISPYPLAHTDVTNDFYQNLMAEKIKKIKPEIVFLNYWQISESLVYNKNNPLDNYISANYQPCPNTISKNFSVYALDLNLCPE